MALRSPTKKPLTLDPVRPNAGLEAAFRKKLDTLVCEMHNSVVHWVTAAYRANTPEMAQDDSPAMLLRRVMGRLSRRWQSRFDAAAPALADYFAIAIKDRADGALMAILKKHGWAVEFKMTKAANDVMQACIGEQVGLIKSISETYFTQIEGLVMRSVAQGGDLKTLTDMLGPKVDLDRINMGRRVGEGDKSFLARSRARAALIARDQNNKMTASMTRCRQQALGITEAIWMHSHGGKHPRPEHVAANGKRYNVKEGMLLNGKYVWPGAEINCRCVSRSVIPGF